MTRHDEKLKREIREFLKYQYPADVVIALKDGIASAIMNQDQEICSNERIEAVLKQNVRVLDGLLVLMD